MLARLVARVADPLADAAMVMPRLAPDATKITPSAAERFNMILITVFAVIALLLIVIVCYVGVLDSGPAGNARSPFDRTQE